MEGHRFHGPKQFTNTVIMINFKHSIILSTFIKQSFPGKIVIGQNYLETGVIVRNDDLCTGGSLFFFRHKVLFHVKRKFHEFLLFE